MAIDVSVGQPATLVVELTDRNVNPTTVFVEMYTSSNPTVLDFGGEMGACPLDRPLMFLAPGTATLAVPLEVPGPDKRQIILTSDKINVHPEGAFSGLVQVVLTEQA